MKVQTKIHLLFLCVLFLCSCQKEISHEVVNTEVDVYVAGFVGDGPNPTWSPNNERPTYWKNGTLVQLNYDESLPVGERSARALSIAVSGNNVYVAGYQIWLSYTVGFRPAGTFWKNGIPLDRDSMNLWATYLLHSLVVSSNDTYMVGWESVINAAYWKNENRIALTAAYSPTALNIRATASSITVSGNDVYVSGYHSEQLSSAGVWSKVFATYWKNGNVVKLTDGSKDANATFIAVSGTDVYVTGVEDNGAVNKAMYWKNGTLVTLTDGSTDAVANSIAISGTDVYVAGTQWDGAVINGVREGVAKYWKNGQEVRLTDGAKYAEAKSIAILGNDVYVAGFEDGVAKYWKNGSPVILGDVSKYSEAYSIFLVKK